MLLKTENGTKVRRPSPADIDDALSMLGQTGNGFAILESTDGGFIQVAGDSEGGFVLEHRLNRHYPLRRAIDTSIPLNEVIQRLQAYVSSDGEWDSGLRFEFVKSEKTVLGFRIERPRFVAWLALLAIGAVYAVVTASPESTPRLLYIVMSFAITTGLMEAMRTGKIIWTSYTFSEDDAPFSFVGHLVAGTILAALFFLMAIFS